MAVSKKRGTNALNERVLKIQCKLYETHFIISLACEFCSASLSYLELQWPFETRHF